MDAIADKIHESIAKRKAEKSCDPVDKEQFRKEQNKLKVMVQQAKIDYLQSSVLQSKNCPQKASYMWSCVNNVFGRTKTKKHASSDSLNLDSLKHFQTIAVTSLHQSAAIFAIPATSCDSNPFTLLRFLNLWSYLI